MWWDYATAVKFRPSKTLDPGRDEERFISMEPAKDSAYHSILNDSEVRPMKIGGMWYPKLFSPTEDASKLIAIHFHGGAYVLGGCRPMEGGWGPDVLAKGMSGLSLCPQYRLAVDPQSRFPAAIQDGLTAYAYVLSLGVPASNIVLSGDSAGANLAITLLRYLVEHVEVMPLPRAALLWSPWLGLAAAPETIDKSPNHMTDYVTSALQAWGVGAYARSVPANHRYISPLGNEFAAKVPIFLQTGSAEVMHDDHIQFVRAMEEIPGNQLETYEIKDAPHDVFAAGQILGFEKEAVAATEAVSRFLEKTKNGVSG